jgi:hypothetical protein
VKLSPSLHILLLLSAVALGACRAEPVTLQLTAPLQRPLQAAGESTTLQVVAYDARGQVVEEPQLRWSSSAPQVASVEAGVVTAHRSGSATIGVRAGAAHTSLEVRVAIPIGIEIRADSADFLEAGRSIAISAVVKNEQNRPIPELVPQWSSSDESVTRVENGRLLGLTPGVTTVTARAGPLSRNLRVQVVRNDFARMAIEPTHLVFERVGQQAQLKVRAFNARGTPIDGVPFTWFSSDWTVVQVSSTGLVTVMGPGRTVVTATAGRRKAAAEVVVQIQQPQARPAPH